MSRLVDFGVATVATPGVCGAGELSGAVSKHCATNREEEIRTPDWKCNRSRLKVKWRRVRLGEAGRNRIRYGMVVIKIFGDRKIRSVWDDEAEIWYFSIVDVVAVLTESKDPLAYWRKLKQRLKAEGNETVTNCHGLKLRAADGKYYKTDVATAEQMFRVIQSIPSPKAEPFKMWMAKVAAERIDQMQDPELSIQQALADYRRLGRNLRARYLPQHDRTT